MPTPILRRKTQVNGGKFELGIQTVEAIFIRETTGD
jgi:hypothetical protein